MVIAGQSGTKEFTTVDLSVGDRDSSRLLVVADKWAPPTTTDVSQTATSTSWTITAPSADRKSRYRVRITLSIKGDPLDAIASHAEEPENTGPDPGPEPGWPGRGPGVTEWTATGPAGTGTLVATSDKPINREALVAAINSALLLPAEVAKDLQDDGLLEGDNRTLARVDVRLPDGTKIVTAVETKGTKADGIPWETLTTVAILDPSGSPMDRESAGGPWKELVVTGSATLEDGTQVLAQTGDHNQIGRITREDAQNRQVKPPWRVTGNGSGLIANVFVDLNKDKLLDDSDVYENEALKVEAEEVK
jgi:hypothetical protein